MLDFQELGLDVVAGTVLGLFGYVIEISIASLGPTFISSNATLYGAIVGIIFFAGSILGKVGSKMYSEMSSSSTNEIKNKSDNMQITSTDSLGYNKNIKNALIFKHFNCNIAGIITIVSKIKNRLRHK